LFAKKFELQPVGATNARIGAISGGKVRLLLLMLLICL